METQFVGVYEYNNTANFLGASCFYQPRCELPLSLSEPSFSIDCTQMSHRHTTSGTKDGP